MVEVTINTLVLAIVEFLNSNYLANLEQRISRFVWVFSVEEVFDVFIIAIGFSL